MGGKQAKIPQNFEIICPKCPLNPIFSIFLNSEGILTCEYRCPFMHFGQIPFDDITKEEGNSHGKYCDRCENPKKDDSKNIINDDLLYCGTCKQFICGNCRKEHDKEKESHKILVPKSILRHTCLEHGKTFIGYCFSCLISVCPECKRHDKHCKKLFEQFYPDKDFIDKYDYYVKTFNDYLKSFKRQPGMNKEHFANFKNRNAILIELAQYLRNNFEEKQMKGRLNGEILINYLNVVLFDYKADTYEKSEDFVNYCKTHLILSNKPISDICTFSRTKSDYNIAKLDLEEFKLIDTLPEKSPQYFKYSPFGGHIVYSLGSNIYFLSIDNNKERQFKVEGNDEISFFNIINYNILCVCCGFTIKFYQLSKNNPFYVPYEHLKELDIFNSAVLEIVGNIEKDLVIRTKNELLVVNNKKRKENYEIVAKMDLEDVNNSFTEQKSVPDENVKKYKNDYYYDYGYNQPKMIKINVTTKVLTTIKAIWENYIVTIEKGIITTRNLNDLKVVKTLQNPKNVDCLVFNGNIIVAENKNIVFYSIPNLTKVSSITVVDYITSLNIINKKTFIVIEKKYVEQFETNTWKKLWRRLSFGENITNLEKIILIGAGKELFLFNKEDRKIYKAVPKEEEEKKEKKKEKKNEKKTEKK